MVSSITCCLMKQQSNVCNCLRQQMLMKTFHTFKYFPPFFLHFHQSFLGPLIRQKKLWLEKKNLKRLVKEKIPASKPTEIPYKDFTSTCTHVTGQSKILHQFSGWRVKVLKFQNLSSKADPFGET